MPVPLSFWCIRKFEHVYFLLTFLVNGESCEYIVVWLGVEEKNKIINTGKEGERRRRCYTNIVDYFTFLITAV